MRTILDTSVLVEARTDDVPDDDLAISAVSLAELHFGLLRADAGTRARRLARLSWVERTFDALPMDEAVAASYGELADAVARIGRNPRRRSFDLLIAATAHAHDARLLTLNPDDFRGLDDLVDVAAP